MISVSPLYDLFVSYALPVFSVIVTAAIGWAAQSFSKATGIKIEANDREAVNTALTNAVGGMLQREGARLKNLTFDVNSPTMVWAIAYVESAVPDALKRFGLGPHDIAVKLRNKIGLLTGQPAPAAATPATAASAAASAINPQK